MMETILITGSNGEIGSQLLSFVKKNNTRIIAFDINEPITNYKNVLDGLRLSETLIFTLKLCVG